MTGLAPPTGSVLRELLAAETNVSTSLAPDGRSVAFVHTGTGGRELGLHRVGEAGRRLVTHPGRTVADLRWTADSATVVYRYTLRGREAWELAAVRVDDPVPLAIAAPGPVAEYWLSGTDPAAVVFAARAPGTKHAGLYRAGLDAPGRAVPIAGPVGYHRWLIDGHLRPRGGTRLCPDGSVEIVVGAPAGDARPVLTIAPDDTVDLAVAGFSRDGARLYVLTSHAAGTRQLIGVDTRTGAVEVEFAHPDLDVGGYPLGGDGVWFDPATGRPDVCTVMGQRLRYHALTARQQDIAARLDADIRSATAIIGRSTDDRTWLVARVHDDAPMEYRLIDRANGGATLLFHNRPGLAGQRLAALEDFCFTAGDGRQIGGYAMRPLDREPPFPTVVLVHGGPAGRDYWRFHADAQYLAALGYLSLHVNYRGSSGFGRDFRLAGHGEWGGRMQEDLYDAVAHAVATGLADPDRVALLGASYGGYAALLGACTRPETVRCAVAISPVCDLVSFTRNPPSYWQPLALLLRRHILLRRDGQQIEDSVLRRLSPAHVLGPACAPLLLAHGVRDPRVPVADVDQFAERARDAGVPVRYLRFPDEGHHVRADPNRTSLFAAVEEFLEVHLARRC